MKCIAPLHGRKDGAMHVAYCVYGPLPICKQLEVDKIKLHPYIRLLMREFFSLAIMDIRAAAANRPIGFAICEPCINSAFSAVDCSFYHDQFTRNS